MSLAKRIMSWKVTIRAVIKGKCWEGERGAEQHSKHHPSGFIMDPPLLYSSHQPSSLTTQHKHAKPPAVSLPSENQTDQGLRLPISWKHSLNIAAHSVPALCAPKGSYVKSNFFWIAIFDFFLLLFFTVKDCYRIPLLYFSLHCHIELGP